MVVVPTGKTLPAGTPLRAMLTPPALSVAVAVPSCASVTTAPHVVAPAPVLTVTFAGAFRTGRTVSLTVIETVAAALVNDAHCRRQASRTVNWKLSGPL
jgi:hypothetical protein